MTGIGGLMMVGLPGLELDDSTRQLIRDHGVNNFILFARNVKNPGQLQKLCHDLVIKCEKNRLAPPLIAIDQEGGSVARLPEPWTQFPDVRKMAESDDPEQVLADYARTCCRELLAAGINMNLAPVLDVCPAKAGYFMERRVLGGDPDEVAHLGALVIATIEKKGVAACAKHFPGLGAARLDPHQTMPTVDRERPMLIGEDLRPFKAAVAAGVAAIMTSHTIYPALDPDWPATLSAKILTGMLRDDLGYNGLVITDDLEMGAIENEMTVAAAALRSFQSGADLMLICRDHAKVRSTIALFTEALVDGRLLAPQIKAALARIDLVRSKFPIHLHLDN